jgi:hypothetical protein
VSYLGEVLEANTTGFTAQARDLDCAPELGSLVKIENGEQPIFAIISGAATGGLEPSRRPGAYGLSREDLALHQPQIFELLKTDFTGIIIGHIAGACYRGYLPPRPAMIHAFVHPTSEAEIALVSGNLNYLRVLASCKLEAGEELLAASLRWFASRSSEPQTYLLKAGKELLKILKDDYDRFSAIMSRVR